MAFIIDYVKWLNISLKKDNNFIVIALINLSRIHFINKFLALHCPMKLISFFFSRQSYFLSTIPLSEFIFYT